VKDSKPNLKSVLDISRGHFDNSRRDARDAREDSRFPASFRDILRSYKKEKSRKPREALRFMDFPTFSPKRLDGLTFRPRPRTHPQNADHCRNCSQALENLPFTLTLALVFLDSCVPAGTLRYLPACFGGVERCASRALSAMLLRSRQCRVFRRWRRTAATPAMPACPQSNPLDFRSRCSR